MSTETPTFELVAQTNLYGSFGRHESLELYKNSKTEKFHLVRVVSEPDWPIEQVRSFVHGDMPSSGEWTATYTDPGIDYVSHGYSRGYLVRLLREWESEQISYLPGNGETARAEVDSAEKAVEQSESEQVVYDEVLEENFLLNDDTRETFTYDERDNLLSGTDEYGHVQIYEYDEHDNVISMGNLDGNVVSYTYDIEDRRLGEVYADGLATSFSYDKDGTIHVETQDWKQGTIRDETIYPSGLTISETKTYNEAGQLIEHVHDGPKGPLTTTYEYDAKGNAIKAITTQPDGTVSVKEIDPPTDEREIGGPTR
jgi:YD repeat-containing protein